MALKCGASGDMTAHSIRYFGFVSHEEYLEKGSAEKMELELFGLIFRKAVFYPTFDLVQLSF